MTSPAQTPALSLLACAVQRFPFGPPGDMSLAGQLFHRGPHATHFSEASDDDETPYAELWLGASHEKGVSKLLEPDEVKNMKLDDALLGSAKDLISPATFEQFPKLKKNEHGGMPFIFKILSAGKALPLQVHPNNQLSEQLRQKYLKEDEDQTVFDSMHKPEIALAVTKFKGFVGFAPPSDVVSRLRKIPELRDLAGRPTKGGPSTALPDEGNVYDLVLKSNGKDEGGDHSWKALMSAFMARILSASSDDTKAAVDKVARRAKADADSFAGDDELGDLILTLNEQHPGDVGVLFAPALMNLATLEPGECIYAPADTIHAWLSGTIIECMPSSVNVLNTGFGPSPSKETLELFTDMLSYAFKPVSDFKLEPSSLCKGLQHYKVPCDEFDVLRARLEPKQSVNVFDGINTKTLDGVAVLVCINGIGQVKGRRSDSDREDHFDLSSGTAVLISNQTSIALTAGAEDLECFVAFFNANA